MKMKQIIVVPYIPMPSYPGAIHMVVGTIDISPTVYGLGEDGKVYLWSTKEGKWRIYKRTELKDLIGKK